MITWEEFKVNKKYWVYAGIIIIVLLIISGGRDDRFESKNENSNVNVITITGHGEVQAVPDIANVSFTIRKEAKTVKDAQTQVTDVETKALSSLKTNGILDADRKAENVSFNPKYEYKNVACSQYGCPSNSVIVGYEAYETITVKIRNVDSVGKIVQDLGTVGVTELSGPNFTVDKEDAVKTQARKLAIDDAKEKAKVLAKDLGIRLGKMTSFNEGGNYPVPMYAKTMSADNAIGASAPAALPVGENTISSDVTITYEIR